MSVTVTGSSREKLVVRLFRKYGQACFYCSLPLGVETATIDHYIPRAAGGNNNFSNLRPSCFDCNNWKADRVPNDDGTIPPKLQRHRVQKSERPDWCDHCFGGRWVPIGSTCSVCGIGPMPVRRPQTLKVKTWLCDHDQNWCIACCLHNDDERMVMAFKALGMREAEAEDFAEFVSSDTDEEVVA